MLVVKNKSISLLWEKYFYCIDPPTWLPCHVFANQECIYCNFTLGNSNLWSLEPPASSKSFLLSLRSFLYTFTLDNSNHVLVKTSRKVKQHTGIQNFEFWISHWCALFRLCFVTLFLIYNREVQYVACGPWGPWSATFPKMIKYFVEKKNMENN